MTEMSEHPFIYTQDKRMFLIGCRPDINNIYDQPAGHKQALPEPNKHHIRFARFNYKHVPNLPYAPANERIDHTS